MTAPPLPAWLPALDGLRGVAVLLVVLTHVGDGWRRALMIYQDADWMPPLQPGHWLQMVCERSAFGVMLFFVISAFTLTVRSDARQPLAAYAIKRIARVGPGYWLAGLAYTAWAGLGPRLMAPDGVGTADLGLAALFGSAWQGGAALAVVPGGWSVSCEVTFYAALPILLWLIDGRVWRAAVLAVLTAVVAQVLARHALTHGGWTYREYFYPPAQAPVFLFGITAALLVRQVRLPRMPGAAVALLAAAVGALPFVPIHEWHLMPYLAFAAVVAPAVALAAVQPPWLLTLPALRWVGEVSYSVYLAHFAVLAPSLWLAERLAPGDGWPTLALHLVLTLAVSLALAGLLHRWVELPGIALGRALIARLPGRRTTVRRA